MLVDVCRRINDELRGRAEFGHTSHFLVVVGGQVVHDAHYHGPPVGDVFSITKSVVATLAGIAVRDGLLRDLDVPIQDVLGMPGTGGQTLRHLLTMTRGSEIGGAYDIDEVLLLPGGWVGHIASAPQLDPPGAVFRYDNSGAHLFGAALARIVGMPLADYAARELFAPLGITQWHWPRDPDGFDYGFGHLRLSAADLAKPGMLWIDRGQRLMDPAFARDMITVRTAGGPPEYNKYGYLMWIDEPGPFAAGWAGQHVTMVPRADAVIVTTGDPDRLTGGWRPARDLVVEHLIPVLAKA